MAITWQGSQKTIPGVGSDFGPSLTMRPPITAAWKGENGDERLWYSTFNGSSWTAQQQIPAPVASSVGPSLTTYYGEVDIIYAAWKGSGTDESQWYSTFDGEKWSAQQQIPGTFSSVGPSLAYSPDTYTVYAAWKGSGTDQRLWYSSISTDFDSSWEPQQIIPGTWSSVGPSLAYHNGKIYAAWKGMDSDESLWFSSFSPDVIGSTWSPQKQIPNVLSSVGPRLFDLGDVLLAVWKGSGTDTRIWWATYNDSTQTWSAQQQIPGVGTSYAPSVAGTSNGSGAPNTFVVAWKGELADEEIWYIQGEHPLPPGPRPPP